LVVLFVVLFFVAFVFFVVLFFGFFVFFAPQKAGPEWAC